MFLLGSSALLLALMLAICNLVAGAVALRQISSGRRGPISPERLAKAAQSAGMMGFAAVSVAVFALLWAIFTNDFSFAYVVHNSSRALPGAYKFAALWSGQAGSLLLWAWLLTGYSFMVRLRRKVGFQLTACVSTILASIEVFFLLLLKSQTTPPIHAFC